MEEYKRRQIIKLLGLGGASLWLNGDAANATSKEMARATLKDNIHHSVCRWTFSELALADLCRLVKQIGFSAIDLVEPKDWPILKAAGIDSSMCCGAEIDLDKGWNDRTYHPTLIKNYLEHIEHVAKAGYKNLICFTGNRGNIDDETGMKNCITGLKQILAHAEKHKVVLHMEILNSRIDHLDYMGDKCDWVLELCKKIDSPNMKMLFDIYHVQINEGDIIRRLKKCAPYIGHYHTGGVPGRGEIGENQELNYRAIMKAILATGYRGYVAQEFLIKGTPLEKAAALKRAVLLCDV